jgi:uncharacterized protein
MQQYFTEERQNQIGTALLAFLAILAIFFVFKTLNEIKMGSYISRQYGYNSISVSGEGEVFAIPDTATFSFSVRERASTVEAAQDAVTKRMDAILAELEKAGVEEENIKTTNYSIYPHYEYREGGGSSPSVGAPGAARPDIAFPAPGREVLVGYEVYHTNEVKIKDTAKAGELLSKVGTLGATDVSGLSFTVEDEDAAMDEARAKAIDDAERKAKVLAKELGVKLVRLVSYYDEVPGGPMPYYGRESNTAFDMAEEAAIAVPVTPGQSEIISRVNLTYEIR